MSLRHKLRPREQLPDDSSIHQYVGSWGIINTCRQRRKTPIYTAR